MVLPIGEKRFTSQTFDCASQCTLFSPRHTLTHVMKVEDLSLWHGHWPLGKQPANNCMFILSSLLLFMEKGSSLTTLTVVIEKRTESWNLSDYHVYTYADGPHPSIQPYVVSSQEPFFLPLSAPCSSSHQ